MSSFSDQKPPVQTDATPKTAPSAPSSAPANASSSSSGPSASSSIKVNNSTYRFPLDATMRYACELSVAEDKPIMMDYWTYSIDKKALVGVRESGEKLLVKSAEEYTSPIAKVYRSMTEYIIVTENSLYVVSSDIPTRRIS
jgi:hypothetical protein